MKSTPEVALYTLLNHYPPPKVTTVLTSITIDLFFSCFRTYINGIIQYILLGLGF